MLKTTEGLVSLLQPSDQQQDFLDSLDAELPTALAALSTLPATAHLHHFFSSLKKAAASDNEDDIPIVLRASKMPKPNPGTRIYTLLGHPTPFLWRGDTAILTNKLAAPTKVPIASSSKRSREPSLPPIVTEPPITKTGPPRVSPLLFFFSFPLSHFVA